MGVFKCIGPASKYVVLEAEDMRFVYIQPFIYLIVSRKVTVMGSEFSSQSQVAFFVFPPLDFFLANIQLQIL